MKNQQWENLNSNATLGDTYEMIDRQKGTVAGRRNLCDRVQAEGGEE